VFAQGVLVEIAVISKVIRSGISTLAVETALQSTGVLMPTTSFSHVAAHTTERAFETIARPREHAYTPVIRKILLGAPLEVRDDNRIDQVLM
jgi:hypothetical protein